MKKTFITAVAAFVVGGALGVGGLHLAQAKIAASKQQWVVVDNTIHPDGSSPYALPASRDGGKLSLNGITVGEHLESVYPVCQGDPTLTKVACWQSVNGAKHPAGTVRLRGLNAIDAKSTLMVRSTEVELDQKGDVRQIYVFLDPHVTAPRDYRTVLSLTQALGQPTTVLATSVQWKVGDSALAVSDDGRIVVAGTTY
ncbi:hypothetical protein [Burkholderia gladioli]|uniref:hypothetical protein n=1 Tax=Burkholderia gladioli TaxID=28095 RepID=UPI001641ECD0|nr:hypothetical protein [Burkholderia gladioli]